MVNKTVDEVCNNHATYRNRTGCHVIMKMKE
jgi:hypothetical protein